MAVYLPQRYSVFLKIQNIDNLTAFKNTRKDYTCFVGISLFLRQKQIIP